MELQLQAHKVLIGPEAREALYLATNHKQIE